MKYTHNCDIDINEGGTVHMMNTHTHLGKHIFVDYVWNEGKKQRR